MANQRPPTQKIPISKVKNSLSGLIETVSREETRILIEKNGAPVAALVSVDDLDRLSQWEREREARFSVIDRMREAFADVPPEEIEREAERTVAEARERIRQRNAEPAARSA